MLKLNLDFLFKKRSSLDKVLRAFKANQNISSITAEINEERQALTIKFKDGSETKGTWNN